MSLYKNPIKLKCLAINPELVIAAVGRKNMRTVIIGNSGSGKSWLSRQLATPDVGKGVKSAIDCCVMRNIELDYGRPGGLES